eukprot:gene15238-21321_t
MKYLCVLLYYDNGELPQGWLDGGSCVWLLANTVNEQTWIGRRSSGLGPPLPPAPELPHGREERLKNAKDPKP